MELCLHRGPGPAVGFSLTELLLVIAISGFLLSIGIPSFTNVLDDNVIITHGNELMAHLRRARAEAIRRNQRVVVCRSQDGITCHPSTHASADWSVGWITFVNTDNNRNRGTDEELIGVGGPLPTGLRLGFNRWWRISFHPSGRAQNGSFLLCDARGDTSARRIVLYLSGRIRLATAGGGSSSVCADP